MLKPSKCLLKQQDVSNDLKQSKTSKEGHYKKATSILLEEGSKYRPHTGGSNSK